MRGFFSWMLVYASTLIVSAGLALPVFSLGLIVHETVSNSLTILIMGLIASLSANWLTNLLRIRGKNSRLLPVVATSAILAVVLAVLFYLITAFAAGALRRIFPVNISLLIAWGIVLSLGACTAAWRLRSSARNLKRDIYISAGLLLLAAVIIAATIAIASLFGLTGA